MHKVQSMKNDNVQVESLNVGVIYMYVFGNGLVWKKKYFSDCTVMLNESEIKVFRDNG